MMTCDGYCSTGSNLDKSLKNLEESWQSLKNLDRAWRILIEPEESWQSLKNLDRAWRILKNLDRAWKVIYLDRAPLAACCNPISETASLAACCSRTRAMNCTLCAPSCYDTKLRCTSGAKKYAGLEFDEDNNNIHELLPLITPRKGLRIKCSYVN